MRIQSLVSCLCVLVCAAGASSAQDAQSRNGPPVITEFSFSPNPVELNQAVAFKAAFAVHSIKDSTGTLDFGDGTVMPLPQDSAEYEALNKGALTHTYTALPAGKDAFVARFTMRHGPFTVFAETIVRVGTGTAIDPVSGVGSTATDDAGQPRGAASRYFGGKANLRIFFTRTIGNNARTDFEDPVAPATVTGLAVSHIYTMPGIFVADSTGLNGAATVGRVRKMINVSALDVGGSGALPDPADNGVSIRKMTGKFKFTSGDADAVAFSGEVMLPAGFNPALAGGNSLSVGIGNVIDTVSVDAKGKAAVPGARNRILKAKVKYPKLAAPLSSGGEIARIDVTYSLADLDVAGFDTEGISSTLRDDEKSLKAVERLIQVDILLGGVAYEGLARVAFKLSKGGESGAIKNLRSIK